MENKDYYESPAIEVTGIDLKAIVCASEREASVQTDTSYEFSNGEW